ncbi:MAG: amino acid ABC transporter permease [Clostridiales bacterium]|nr:amino acid ABC transporter permease [Clostridiales bacterium]
MQSLAAISPVLNVNNINRLLQGLLVTARIAIIAVVLSIVIGIVVGVIMTSKNKVIKLLTYLYLEIVRIIPILVLLFIMYFGVSKALNVHLDGEFVSIVVFTFWGAAEMGDIVRGALTSIPKHQEESARSLGLSKIQIYRYILIPQAVRRMLPGAINLCTRIIKTTSLLILVGVVEVIKVGQQIIERSILQEPKASFWIYGLIFILYFILCYPLSLISRKLEKKWES